MMRKRANDAVLIDTRADRAVIDIGSNTIRMVAYGGPARAPTVLLNEKVAARLGRSLSETGRIPEKSVRIALAALARYKALIEDLGIGQVETVATAAAREAENGPEFLDAVRAIGLDPRLLAGEEEARCSALGVIGAFPGARGVVADLGGGSLELVSIDNEACEHGVSLPLGTLRLPHVREGGADRLRKTVIKAMKVEDWDTPHRAPLYLVGGTWRALAKFARHEIDWPLNDTHGFELEREAALQVLKALGKLDVAAINNVRGISSMRAAALPDAGALLQVLVEELEPQKLVFSSWGLREGLLYARLEPTARLQDPLLAGIASFATPRGCSPQRAARIAGWMVSAVSSKANGRERLRLSATMLALASKWIEKNLRARQAMDWALHKRWIGLSSEGRAMLAAAVAANCGETSLPRELHALASGEALEEAVHWGLAIRLFRRLGGGSDSPLQTTALNVIGHRLVLSLGESRAALGGYQAEKDLANLAARLDLEPHLEVVPDEMLKRH